MTRPPKSEPPPNDLFEFLRNATDGLAKEYQRIQSRVMEDPGTAGDQGEENWATLLRQWLPPYYQVVTKGRILGPDGRAGPQVDVLVLSPAYPRHLLDKKLYLAGGVIAAFECKITLRRDHLREFFKNCAAIRALTPRTKGTLFKELRSPLIYGLLSHSHEWKAAGSAPAENIQGAMIQHDLEFVQTPADMPDLTCVADVGVWSTMKVLFSSMPASGGPPFPYPNAFNKELKSGYTSALYTTEGQQQSFTPIGAMLGLLYEKMSWHDLAMRDLARYLQLVNLRGNGRGYLRPWPIEVLSGEFRHALPLARLVNGGDYDEWNITVF